MIFFLKDLFRTIKNSLGRFIAIAGIIALGVGFYGGLRMYCDDMKMVSSNYYNNTNLMDIRVVSTLGLSDQNIEAIKNLDCIDGVMPAHETDVIVDKHGEKNTVRLHSINEASYTAEVENSEKVISDDKNFINRPILIEGQWPKNSNECIISKKATGVSQQQIGDEIEIKECNSDIDKTLSTKKLKVVGFVKSSYYVSTISLGPSTLGRGQIDQYAYVPRETFADAYPYTEVFLTVKDAKNYYYNSAEYQKLIDDAMVQINNIAPAQSEIRSADVKSEAQQKVDAAQNELNDKRDSAENELNKNEKKLTFSKKQLDDSKKQIENGQQQLNAAFIQYQQQHNEVFSQINEARALADQAKQDFEKLKTQSVKNIDNLKLYCENVRIGYTNALTYLPSLSKELDLSKNVLCLIESTAQKYITDEFVLFIIKQAVNSIQEFCNKSQQFVNSFYDELNNAPETEKQDVYDKYILDFNTIFYWVEIVEPYTKALFNQIDIYIDSAINDINQKENEANSLFSDIKKQLDETQTLLNDAKAKFEAGNTEYLKGLQKFLDAKEQAFGALNNVQQQIDDAQTKVDNIENAEFLIMDRSKNVGCFSLILDAERVDGISKVFPFLFFLVAALVALTSMTRMVEEERILIGTKKALGVSFSKISSKYILYVLFAGLIGSALGLLIIPQIIPQVIMIAYTIMYNYPIPAFVPFDAIKAGVSIAMGLGVSLIATIAASINSLKQVPANLMLPKAPKAGKQILIEKIKPIWKLFNFNWKIALRNMFLYKKRLFMTIIGIAGCTALLLTGFGLSDSINDVVKLQYDNIMHDNFVTNFKNEIDNNDKLQIENIFSQYSIGDDFAYLHEETMVSQPKGKSEQNTIIDVPENKQFFKSLRTLHNRETQEEYEITDEGALITEKLAMLMNIKAGDTIKIYVQDKIGNAGVDSYEIKVANIVENHVGHYIYMTPAFYEKTFNKQFKPNAVIAKYIDDEQKQEQLLNEVSKMKNIKTVGYTDKAKDRFYKMLKSVDMIVVVLLVFAAILAFVVLFNLTNINICERLREIATLKVLGAKKSEISMYIHRETLVLSAIGALAGVALGFVLENFVITSAEVDMVMFGRNIYLPSILYSIVITLTFTVIVIFMTINKTHKISMVESLKSIE